MNFLHDQIGAKGNVKKGRIEVTIVPDLNWDHAFTIIIESNNRLVSMRFGYILTFYTTSKIVIPSN